MALFHGLSTQTDLFWEERGRELAREGDGKAEPLDKDAERRGADAEHEREPRNIVILLDGDFV